MSMSEGGQVGEGDEQDAGGHQKYQKRLREREMPEEPWPLVNCMVCRGLK